MLNIQADKTDRRDKLRLRGKDEVEAIVKRINESHDNDPMLCSMLIDLHRRLQKHKGKRVYGYLNKNDKELVNKIVEQIEKIPEIKELYELWYEKQEDLRRMYSDTLIPRVPLSENPDFKTIRNAVVRAADALVDQACETPHPAYEKTRDDPVYVTTAAARLLNNVSQIFQDKFHDNPEQVPKVDIKLRRRLLEKDEAHGIKHG